MDGVQCGGGVGAKSVLMLRGRRALRGIRKEEGRGGLGVPRGCLKSLKRDQSFWLATSAQNGSIRFPTRRLRIVPGFFSHVPKSSPSKNISHTHTHTVWGLLPVYFWSFIEGWFRGLFKVGLGSFRVGLGTAYGWFKD